MIPAPLDVPQRVLLGPGPSDVAPAVLSALAKPTLGHLDPLVLRAMDELADMLRRLYRTQNAWTLATSGTGTSGMEACLANLVRSGDRVLVCVHGYFGLRLAEIARRSGADVTVVEGEWGRPSDLDRAREAARGGRFDLLCAVHAETSTGVLQDLTPLRALADELGALLVVDAVTSLGCVPLELDAWGVDAVYSCSQKGLSCTPGLSPVSFSPRAVERIRKRADTSPTFYLDANLLMGYWAGPRGYHHTASSNLYCALHEAARLALEEGLEARWQRHARLGAELATGLEALGLKLCVDAAHRLPQLTVVEIPEGVDDATVRGALLERFGIEIGGGLGAFKGRVWRIGLMGSGATPRNVALVLAALRAVLAR
ncbi:MAG TPA: alanine--glyoxylate aminotransferase family protein [Planctomycetota bacterium]|nr:alanine--glyoxylate aminotransferase family protein [Planctomycetota bacterium]